MLENTDRAEMKDSITYHRHSGKDIVYFHFHMRKQQKGGKRKKKSICCLANHFLVQQQTLSLRHSVRDGGLLGPDLKYKECFQRSLLLSFQNYLVHFTVNIFSLISFVHVVFYIC